MTAQDVLDRLLAIFPAFGPVWESEENYFRAESGSFTRCGVFARFSHFLRGGYEQFEPSSLAALGTFVTECAESDDSDLRDAVGACLLENLEGERFSADFSRYLNGEARRLFWA